MADTGGSSVDCPYCEGEGCSECDGTGQRYSTYVSAGDGLSAVIHGSAPLTDEAADAITAVLRAAYDAMATDAETDRRGAAVVGRRVRVTNGDYQGRRGTVGSYDEVLGIVHVDLDAVQRPYLEAFTLGVGVDEVAEDPSC